MSSGIVVCSKCKREVHQGGVSEMLPFGWYHCEDKTARCDGATSIYPASKSDIKGDWCGIDEMVPW